MLVDRQVVRGYTYPEVIANDTAIEFELCVEQDLEFYEESEAYGDTYVPVSYIEVADEHYILNGNYVDIDELRITLGGDCQKYIEDAIKNMEY